MSIPPLTPLADPALGRAPKNPGLDALRAAVTLLVVFHHTAITYGAIGGWFYKEVLPNDSLSSKALIFFCTFNQAFFMGLFFLLAGYFTPRAIERHGAWRYLRERFLRLGVPLLFFGFVLGPFTIALARTAHGEAVLATLQSLWRDGEFERGPLWFCQALLMFAVAATVVHACVRRPASAPRPPSNTMLLLAALLTGAAAFVLRLWWPVGTQWWGLQLGYFAGYITLFWAGDAAASSRWLEQVSASQMSVWRRVMWVTLPVLPVLALVAPAVPALQGPAEGGWHPLAAVYAFWEPLVAWGVILRLLWRFQHWPGAASPLWRRLSDRAYAIFVLHAPVVVAVSLAWKEVHAPPLIKFVVTGSVSCWLTYLLAGAWLALWRRLTAGPAARTVPARSA
jgi:peptidoglycan/LPS O-acetylase OafA/YrhL